MPAPASVSIPFEQGDVFRLDMKAEIVAYLEGLNPFRAGRCLSTILEKIALSVAMGLNPFRAGRCLSTNTLELKKIAEQVSIPFEQGDVFRLT